MASRKRSVVELGLLLGGAFVLAAGCGSDDKKVVQRNDGGEAGAAGAEGLPGGQNNGGTSTNVGAGAGGVDAGDAGANQGAAGASALGGAGGVAAGGTPAGEAGETSVGGFPSVDCTAAGDTAGLSFSEKNVNVCRGALAILNFSVDTSEQQFVCCGTSSAGYDFEGHGVSDNDGGGYLGYVVPGNTQLGTETLNVTCASGAVATPVSITVTDTPAPVVTGVTQLATVGGTITVTGSNLANISLIQVVPLSPTGEQFFCNIDEASLTDTQATCDLPGGMPSADYRVVVAAARCGAVNSPTFAVTD